MGTHGDPWEPMGTHGSSWEPMGTHGDPWIIHGLSMDYPWIIHGQSMDHPWIIHGLSMDYPWIIHGLSMDYPWIIHGYSMDNPRTAPGGFIFPEMTPQKKVLLYLAGLSRPSHPVFMEFNCFKGFSSFLSVSNASPTFKGHSFVYE